MSGGSCVVFDAAAPTVNASEHVDVSSHGGLAPDGSSSSHTV